MASRPIFVPRPDGPPYVSEVSVAFRWYPGLAKAQAQKSIRSLHLAASEKGIIPVLEISSKSTDALGVALSAFNLAITVGGIETSVECAFQGSKVFRNGGPYTDLYRSSSKEAKTDRRLKESGELVAFRLFDVSFPTEPKTAFYDWLYITALTQNPALASRLVRFQGFSDIAFNPERSVNCQARSAALFVGLTRTADVDIERIAGDFDYYLRLVTASPGDSASQLMRVVQLGFPTQPDSGS